MDRMLTHFFGFEAPEHRRSTAHRLPHRATIAFVVALVIPSILAAAAARGATSSIYGYAHVAGTTTQTSKDELQLTPYNGLLAGNVSLGGSTANFSLFPDRNGATVSGQSAKLSFADWGFLHKESQADAYMQIRDNFTINGSNLNGKRVNIYVNWSGLLTPNLEFESDYLAAYGTPTITAEATLDLTVGFINAQGQFYAGTERLSDTASSDGIRAVTPFTLGPYEIPQSLTQEDHTIGFNLTIGGVGLRGGAFNLSGIGGSAASRFADSLLQQDTLGSSEDILDTSFFEIVVELPPGLSISGGGSYIRQVTIPEPTGAGLALLSLLGLAARPPMKASVPPVSPQADCAIGSERRF